MFRDGEEDLDGGGGRGSVHNAPKDPKAGGYLGGGDKNRGPDNASGCVKDFKDGC